MAPIIFLLFATLPFSLPNEIESIRPSPIKSLAEENSPLLNLILTSGDVEGVALSVDGVVKAVEIYFTHVGESHSNRFFVGVGELKSRLLRCLGGKEWGAEAKLAIFYKLIEIKDDILNLPKYWDKRNTLSLRLTEFSGWVFSLLSPREQDLLLTDC